MSVAEHEPSGLTQEPERVPGRLVAGIIAAVIGATVGSAFIAAGVLHLDRADIRGISRVPGYPVARDVAGIQQLPIDGPARGLERERAARDALDRYGWVDRRLGIAHVPIDVAMRWMVDEASEPLATPDPALADEGSPRAPIEPAEPPVPKRGIPPPPRHGRPGGPR